MKPHTDSAETAQHLRRAYGRIFRIVTFVALCSAAVAVAALYFAIGEFQLHASIAMAIGIGLSVLLGGALMGLVFMSNATGHDDRARDATEHDRGD